MQFSATILALAGLIASATSQTPAAQCGVKGYDKGTRPAFHVNSTITAPAACKSLCTASTTPKCEAFAVGMPSCLLYNVTVTGNINAMNTSSDTFSDASCAV